MKTIRYILVILITAVMAKTSFGAKIADYDLNNDGMLDKKEFRTFLIHESGLPYGKFDKKKTVIIDGKKYKKIDGVIDEDAFVFMEKEMFDKIGHAAPYSYEEIDKVYNITKTKNPLDKLGLLIRSSHEDISLSAEAKGFKKAEPAKFAYTRNQIEDEEVWQASGSIMRPIIFGKKEVPDGFDAIAIIPSVTFERLTSNDPGSDVDTLVFRLGSDFEMPGFIAGMQNIRFNLAYATDFDFESEIGALEFQYEPTYIKWGFGAYKHWFDPLLPRFRLILHGEWGETFDAGDKEDLVDDQEFLRLGPKFQAFLRWKTIEQLTFKGSVNYRKGLIGEPDDALLWETALNYKLDEKGRYSIEINYKDGDIPLTNDDVRSIGFNFGVKH